MKNSFKIPSITATVRCKIRRLVKGLPKIGKTYKELKRSFRLKKQCTIIVGLVDKRAKQQCKNQCLEIGYKEENIWLVNELPKINSDGHKDFRGKIIIVNLHENYDQRVNQLITDIHQRRVHINFIVDEYDLVAVGLQMKKWMTRWEKLNGWIDSLKTKDSITFISATNAVGWIMDLGKPYTEVIKIRPYKDGYFGPSDLEIRSISDSEKDELDDANMPSSIKNRIKKENTPKEKALLKLTNRVTPTEEYLYHAKIAEALEEAGISVVCFNGQEEFTQEEYDNAVVIIAGQLANRNALLEDLTTQYIIFGKKATQYSIIQALRICGYRIKRPIIYVPESLKEKLVEAIKFEDKLYEEEKGWYDYPRAPLEAHPCLTLFDNKIAHITKSKAKVSPKKIINVEQFDKVLEELFPMIDILNENQLHGTRIYQNRSAKQICSDTINTSPLSATRVQDRNMFLPKKDWSIPKNGEAGRTLTMGINYNGQINCSSYWIEEVNGSPEVKIALWQNLEKANEKIEYSYNGKNHST